MALLLSKVSSLSTEKAAAILRSPSYLRKASGRPPVKPNSGDVYIFHAELEKQDDWRCDQHRWVSQGVHCLPKAAPIIKKMYFQIDTVDGPNKGFQRHAYQLLGDKRTTVIHYIGDTSLSEGLTHRGNTTNQNSQHYRTLPSYMVQLKQKAISHNLPSVTYKKEVEKIRNLRYQMRHGTRLSQDSIYNIHMLAYEISGFVRKIVTFPDLEVVFGMAEVVDGLERELQLSEPGQLLSYDTTFQLGNFYLSLILYKSKIFQEEPCIPALFLIHERKFTSTHATFFSELKKVVPSIQRSRIPIVTDRERAITSAIKSVLPEIPNLSCWNHIFQDVRRWLTVHGAPQSESTLYIGHLRQLFSQPSLEEYHATLQQLRGVWDDVFDDYYTKHIHPCKSAKCVYCGRNFSKLALRNHQQICNKRKLSNSLQKVPATVGNIVHQQYVATTKQQMNMTVDDLQDIAPKKRAWSKNFTQKEVAEALAVSDPNCSMEYYTCAQAHDLNDVLLGQDLTGEAVDAFLILISARAKTAGTEVYPMTHKCHTFMATQNYAIEQWIPVEGLKSYDYILVPVVAHSHWTLGVIDKGNKSVSFYDSIGGQNCSYVSLLKLIGTTAFPEIKTWTLFQPSGFPKQFASRDCGVFIVMYALYVTSRAQWDFTQSDMTRIRMWLVTMLAKYKDNSTVQIVYRGTKGLPILKGKVLGERTVNNVQQSISDSRTSTKEDNETQHSDDNSDTGDEMDTYPVDDDILRAVVDYSTAPEVDENDITSMYDHPRDWVTITIRMIQDHKPLPTLGPFTKFGVRSTLRNREEYFMGKIKKGCYFFDKLVENRRAAKSTDYCGLGPIRGQLMAEVFSYLFTIALPVTGWQQHTAKDISELVLYPEAMVLLRLIKEILEESEMDARRLYLTGQINTMYSELQ